MKKGMNFILGLVFLAMLLITPSILANGTCSLDKEVYHPGETGTISCVCTSNNERSQTGYFVWMYDNGTIIDSILTSSGDCKNAVFGNSIIFPQGTYLGNATFSLNADGSGIPSNWNGGTDVISDNFNVSGAHITDCIIKQIQSSESIQVGGTGAIKFKVTDAITNESIVHASCIVEGQDINGNPLVFEPDAPGNNGYKPTSAGGHVGFTHELKKEFWEVNTTYIFQLHCYSLPNSTYTDVEHVGFLETSGIPAGMKTCTAEAFFTTNEEDFRSLDSFQITTYIFLSILLILIAGLLLNISLKTDYDRWYKSIQTKYNNKNIIKVAISSIGYNLIKESFMIIYILLLPVVLMINEFVTLANITSISSIINIFATIYTIGMLIVIIMFFGKIQEFITTMIDYTRNEKWGLN